MYHFTYYTIPYVVQPIPKVIKVIRLTHSLIYLLGDEDGDTYNNDV